MDSLQTTLSLSLPHDPPMHEAASTLLIAAFACLLLLLGASLACLPCALCVCRRDTLRCGTLSKWSVSMALLAVAWLAPLGLWFGYSPLNACTRRVVYSYPHGTDRGLSAWTPFWCARRCVESSLVYPNNVSHLRELVRTHASVRAVGAGHSSTDLQCADDGALMLPVHEEFCSFGGVETEGGEEVASFGAGCTVEHALRVLLEEGYQLHGFGGIAQQRLGGAIATSLHGQHTVSFATHLREVTAVLADGSVVDVRGDELRAWTGSMGRLGVVVSMRLRVHPVQHVSCETQVDVSEEGLASALRNASLAGFEAKRLLSPSTASTASTTSTSPSYVVRTCVEVDRPDANASSVVRYEDKDDFVSAFGVDNVAIPFVMLFGTTLTEWDSFASLLFRASGVGLSRVEQAVPSVNDYRVPVSFNPHFDEEYAVPIDGCHAALEEVREHASQLGLHVHAFLRRVDADASWLSWASSSSCAIRLEYYDYNRVDLVEFERQFRLKVESIVVARGGGGHRGKPWYGSGEALLRNAPRRDDFEAYRRRVDPTSKFENAFTSEMGGGERRVRSGLPPDLQVRAFVWRLSVWVAVSVSALVGVFLCAMAGRRLSTPTLSVSDAPPPPTTRGGRGGRRSASPRMNRMPSGQSPRGEATRKERELARGRK